MIKAEIFQDRALLLDRNGRVWQVRIGHDDQPEIQMLDKVPHETINRLMDPVLSRYIQQL
jgi:hypothetical protein